MEADCDLIAERVLYWINKFRAEEGKPAAICLTGITMTFAKMRAQSLVGDFRHDPLKSREIATKLKFGRYMNPPEAVKKWNNPNIPQEEIEAEKNKPPYYDPTVGEALALYGGFSEIYIDSIGHNLATCLRESPGHWAYVGIRKYLTIAVATEGKQTYCALITGEHDSDASPDKGWTKKDLEYYGPDYVDPESPYL